MVDVHYAAILTIEPPLVLFPHGHFHGAFGDTAFLLSVPNILGPIDVHVSLDGIEFQRPTFLG
ncbi:hypothetical protein D3C76_1620660 [compost metagenome]